VLTGFAALLWMAGSVSADDSSDAQQPMEQPAPSGPTLQPLDTAPVICDPAASRFRYLEVRGTGFDAWATQRLVGNLTDEAGAARVQWGSVWVTPQGRLTLEVNLCADPFRGRPALPAGNYALAVGPGTGAAIASTSIALSPPPEPPAEGEPQAPPSGVRASATPATIKRSTQAQPLPQGTPGTLADGWQLVVMGVTPDAWSVIHSAVPSSLQPASDQRDLLVQLQAVYTGQGTGVFSAMRLSLVSGIQTTYDQLRNGCGIVPDMVPPNLVTPGGSVRGNVCFQVRASDLDSLVLFDNQPAENDRVYFSLK
jgi:hypothetical protein